MNEFNLSEKMNLIHCSQCGTNKYTCFSQDDVKKFIKRLKEEIDEKSWLNDHNNLVCEFDLNNFIDKLAGKELI